MGENQSSLAGRPLPSLAAARGALAWWLAEIGGLVGRAEARPDRAPADLTIRVGAPGTADGLSVTDRRGAAPRTYRVDPGAEDLPERLRAIRGAGRGTVTAKVLVDPASCFLRDLTLPAAALPRMRDLLAQELEAATPFRQDGVHADWYVEGEDAQARTLKVRHVILKRARLDPLLEAVRAAGLVPGPVTVGRAEDQAMPVDLLSGGHRPMPRALRGLKPGDLGLLALALLLGGGALAGLQAHQAATLDALDANILAARRAAAPRLPPAVQAGAQALAAERALRPPVAAIWEAVAAALPDSMSAEALRLDGTGLTLTLIAPDAGAALRALAGAALPGFGPPILRDAGAPAGPGRTRLTLALPPASPVAQPLSGAPR